MEIEELSDALESAYEALLRVRQEQARLQRDLEGDEISFHYSIDNIVNYFDEGKREGAECLQKLIEEVRINRQKLKKQRENLVRFEKEIEIADYGYNKVMFEILYYLADKEIIL
jgi:hypothetical protein